MTMKVNIAAANILLCTGKSALLDCRACQNMALNEERMALFLKAA